MKWGDGYAIIWLGTHEREKSRPIGREQRETLSLKAVNFKEENSMVKGLDSQQREFTPQEQQIMNEYRDRYISELNSRSIISELGLTKARNGGYICPACGNGTGSDGTGSVKVKDNKVKCYDPRACFGNKYQDVLGALCVVWNCKPNEVLKRKFPSFDYGDALKQARESGSLHSGTGSQPKQQAPNGSHPNGEQVSAPTEPKPEKEITPPPDQTEFYKQCVRASSNPAAAAYLTARGFSAEVMDKYKLMYWEKEKRVILPVSKSFYLGRATDDRKPKYRQPKDTPIQIFNAAALTQTAEPVYIVEGMFDALSIIESGGKAVSINSASNVETLIEAIRGLIGKGCKLPPLLLRLDPDDGGKIAEDKLTQALTELSLPYRLSNILGDYHDANDRLTADREGLTAAIAAEIRATTKPDNTADYLTTKFFDEISQFQERGDIPTGFKGYDNRYRGLFAGVYIMAAVSSLGKTTFVHQLGENLATQGNHVIYFSTEQNRLELVSKSIARRSASADYTKGASSTDIRTGRFIPSNMKELVSGYIYDVGDRYSIIYTGISGLTPAYVREYVENYMNANKVKPIVIIDYLQVMRPDDEKLYSDRKRALDDSFHKLIALAKEHTLTVIVISSINRSSYLSPIDFESFKESGELEFGADVVLGLQLECMNDELFTMNNKLIDKRKKVKEAKTAIPRHVELVTLKDRYNGLRDTDGGVYFDYYPQFDLFADGHKHTPTPTSSEVESEYEFDDGDERL